MTDIVVSWRFGLHYILYRAKEKRIRAIVDWERSGWLPEYWKYCRAGATARMRCPSKWDLSNLVVDTSYR